MTPEQAQALAARPMSPGSALFHPAYKLDTGLKRDGTHLYNVRIERGADCRSCRRGDRRRAARRCWPARRTMLLVAADAAQLDRDRRRARCGLGRELHASTRSITSTAAARSSARASPTRTATMARPRSPRWPIPAWAAARRRPRTPISRPAGSRRSRTCPVPTARCCYNVINDGAVDVDSGHGTHVAGSVLSDGGASGEGKGVAPAARLVFQAIENYVDFTSQLCKLPARSDGYYLIGIPSRPAHAVPAGLQRRRAHPLELVGQRRRRRLHRRTAPTPTTSSGTTRI